MALLQITSLPFSFAKLPLPRETKSSYLEKRSFNLHGGTQPKASFKVYNTNQTITRRSANFEPSTWSYDYIQSLSTEYKVCFYLKKKEYQVFFLSYFSISKIAMKLQMLPYDDQANVFLIN